MINTNSNEKIDKIFSIICEILNKDFEIQEKITNANTPVIKAKEIRTGLKLDISVNNRNGVENSMIIMNEIKDKKLRNIIIILKILLKINNLGETTLGGMNSFLLFHLVYYFVVIQKSTIENEFQLLEKFLFYYGFEFVDTKYMLVMKGIQSKMILKKNNKALSVKTTLSKNDIGGQCKKYDEIKKLFQITYNKMNDCINKLEFSILSKLNFK